MRALLILAVAALAGLGLLRLLVPRLARHFIYQPEPLRPQESQPRYWGFPEAREIRFAAFDGTSLHAWWFPAVRVGAGTGSFPDDPSAAGREGLASGAGRCGAALYLHGNAGHLAHRGEIAAALAGLGLDVLLPDYRGYGLSEGRPAEEDLYRDAEAAHETATRIGGWDPDRLLVVGNSLGSAVAVELARRRPVAGLVLLGAFPSTVAVGRNVFRWLPDGFLRWEENRFDVLPRVRELRIPVLVAVGAEDRMVPVEAARSVFEAAAGPKRWYVAEGAGHNDLFTHRGLWREVQRFASEVLGCG